MMMVKAAPHVHPTIIFISLKSLDSWSVDWLCSSGVDLTLMLESAEVELLAVIPDTLTVGEVVPGDFVSEVTMIPEGSLVEFREARIALAVLFSGTALHSSTTGSM